MNIWSVLSEKFIGRDSVAITNCKDISITYKELGEYVNFVADLCLNEATSNNRVAVLAENPLFESIFILSAIASGYTVIPVSLKYGQKLCEQIISLSDPSLILSDHVPDEALLSNLNINTKNIVVEALQKSKAEALSENSESNDAFIMFTSGTTGIPKGAVLTHGNIISNILSIADYFKITDKDKILIARPLYHAAVLTGEFLVGLYKGLEISFYEENFLPQRVMSYIAEKQITVFCATPTIFNYFTHYASKIKINLRCVAISGEMLSQQIVTRIISAFPDTDFYHVYGLTEASPRVAYLKPSLFRNKVGSVGVPINHTEFKIANGDNECSAHEVGELIISGPNVMKAYWCDPVLTSKTIIDGWLYTGDMAYYDENYFIYILGRKDNMIIRAGMNIYPQEIENALLSSAEINEVMVYGESDERMGQKIVAEVVLANPDSDIDVAQICRDNLPEYKWPAEIKIVSDLEKNPSGKIIRKV